MSPFESGVLELAIAVGHLAIFVYLVNVVHAFGSRERYMTVCKLVFLGWLLAVGGLLTWEAIRTPFWDRPVWVIAYSALCALVGGVLFPAFTIQHHWRRRPKAVEHRSTAIDLAAIHGHDALVGNGRYSRLLRLSWNESLRLRKVDWEIEIPNLPTPLDGLTILQVSDLHFAPCFKRRYFEEVVRHASEWTADLVFFTGDLIDHKSGADWIQPILSKLRGKYGQFAILGNHDYEHQIGDLLEALESAGFTTLEGKTTNVEIAGKRVLLAGTSYPWGNLPDLETATIAKADFSILLSHAPDLFHWAARRGFQLMFSGHNHGGQIRLPFVGAVFMPSRYSRKFDRGFFRERQLTLHVCQGIAGKHPIRFGGCIPELNRLTLRSPVAQQPPKQLDASQPLEASALT